MSEDVIIIGASGHGKVIADIIKKSGDIVYGYLDDDLSKPGVMGRVSDCEKYKDKYFIIGIGNNAIRKRISEEYSDLNYYTAIHPSADIAEDAVVGAGTAVMAKAVINASAEIGRHCIINTGAIVEHDNRIGDYVHISPNATLCGTVTVGESTHIGAGAVVRNNISIADNVTIGCGGCVVKNIEVPGKYIGIPVKEIV